MYQQSSEYYDESAQFLLEEQLGNARRQLPVTAPLIGTRTPNGNVVVAPFEIVVEGSLPTRPIQYELSPATGTVVMP